MRSQLLDDERPHLQPHPLVLLSEGRKRTGSDCTDIRAIGETPGIEGGTMIGRVASGRMTLSDSVDRVADPIDRTRPQPAST